ncbi:MAG: glycosyltransferase family 4 protein, partial [Acidobacteria bacterium]|nr:glycosyltransferase family 4 protein [Acidobacteriota bacterium]
MRLAVVTQSRDRVGGLEAYIESILPALAQYHDVAFWSASETVSNRGAVALPIGVPALTVDRSAPDPVHRLRAWRPDLLFAHGLDDAVLESDIFRVAPVVLVEHTYHGTCISSAKTMSWPIVQTCERRFGAACLALYFPRRCGGLNPVTMAKSFRTQSRRLAELRRAAAVVTLSAHMADEVLRNGVRPERVHIVPPFVSTTENRRVHNTPGRVCRLLYLGRLERLKGVTRLLAALRPVADRLQRPVRLVVAGDGTERHALEAYASIICAASPRIAIQFTGWQGESARQRLLADTDALVVPSLWPEPFGLVGLEAAAAGVPAVAFATGGIPEWLRDGENGCLAPSLGARPDRLADALVRCVGTPEALARFSAGARRLAAEWTLDRHIARL